MDRIFQVIKHSQRGQMSVQHTGFQVCEVGGLTAEAPAVPRHQKPRGRVVFICEEGSKNSCRGFVTSKTI